MRPEIEAYLREHGPRYTTDALRRQLITAGHDPAEVDAALRATEAIRIGQARPASGLTDAAWAMYLIGAVVWVAGVLLLVALASGLSNSENLGLFVAIYAVAYFGLGYVVVRLVRWLVSRFEVRGVGAFLIGLALIPVYGALVLGTCLAASNLAT